MTRPAYYEPFREIDDEGWDDDFYEEGEGEDGGGGGMGVMNGHPESASDDEEEGTELVEMKVDGDEV